MTEGAPDYVHLRQILAKDALGNLVPVACDPGGRIILLPYGTQTVSQDDPTRTIQGADGLDLYTIAVDAAGRLIMLPYGWDGATYRPLKVDDEGRMIGVMKGQADVKWGLRGWWKFVASEGTTIKDYSGYGNNGSSINGGVAGVTYTDGVIGQAIALSGIDDYVAVPNSDSLDIATTVTFEAWFYSTLNGSEQYLLGEDSAFLVEKQNNNKMRFRFYEEGVGWATSHITSLSYTALSTWHHIVVTYDNVSVKMYMNGIEIYTNDDDSEKVINTPDNILYMGCSWPGGANEWYGRLDEIRIYGRALSADEVAWRYANTNPLVGKPTRMIAVDSEGRMRVSVEGLPYKSQVAYRDAEFWAAAGDHLFISDAVPEGKLWVITTALVTTTGTKCNELVTSIYHAGQYYTIEYEYNAGACNTQKLKGQIIMSAGDVLVFTINGAAAGASGICGINGYELDVD
jgi:hypothetical protein